MKNLIKRALTGIIFVTVIVGAICYHPISFLLLFCLITGLTLWEFYGLVQHYEKAGIKRTISVLGGVYLFVATFLYANGKTDGAIFLPYLMFIMYTLISELYFKETNPINNWALSLFPQIYCAGFFSLLNFVVTSPDADGIVLYNPLYLLAIFIFVWVNDTGAYVFGSLFGKHRLFERISPKKSWEGFIGGMIAALLTSLIFSYYSPDVHSYQWLGLAATIVIFATWGDLTESLLKRTLGIKDSGNVLPGHGGMMDRFDSIMMAAPAAYIYIELLIRN
ncbi:MAG: phosphatidate cytidylyltransferase [Tannerellaceae bacterium]|nr:phosphatidate cytidylyltransferase [Tannerellaceae bacterium]